jgi:hypothetical protein
VARAGASYERAGGSPREADAGLGDLERMTTGPRVAAQPGEPIAHRIALYAAVAFCLFSILVQLGWLSFFQYTWGFTLWQYLPPPLAYGLALLLFALCWRAPRARLLRALSRLRDASRHRAARPLVWLALLAMPPLLWLTRERIFLGDSKILLFALAKKDTLFYFPDVGATYLIKASFDFGRSFGWGGVAGLQAFVCLTSIPALLCFLRVGSYLAPSAGWAVFATCLMVLGGMPRIYAGHVEVYSVVLIGVGLYFWSSLAYLRGRCRWTLPCLALGLGLWIHFCFLFLIPSLLVLTTIADPGRPPRRRVVQWTFGLAVAALPLIAFLALLVLSGNGRDVVLAVNKLIAWAEVTSGRELYETVWIQPPWERTETGTKYTLYSWLHLKYLANSFFLLAPAAVPVVLAYAIFSLRRLWSTPEAAFLSTASLAMIVYASIVRPVFGPYEWDLFIVTAICLAALAAHLLAHTSPSASLVHLCVVFVGATVLLVAIPWVMIGTHVHRPAGPFAIDALHASPDGSFYDDFVRKLAPWL